MSALDLDGGPLDPEARLYEHAFLLLAFSALGREDEALETLGRLAAFRHGAGGFAERGAHPFQANAQMHLLEAALVWRDRGGASVWGDLVQELADLAANRFIDPATGALNEFFDDRWRPLAGAGGLIEPGHMMEWAWLLAQCGRGDVARGLYDAACRGADPSRGVLVNALWPDLSVRDAAARLWPQTEHLKAALILGERDAALRVAGALAKFLQTPTRGVWRERMAADGRFLQEPSPATSLYHLYLAIRELSRFAAEPC